MYGYYRIIDGNDATTCLKRCCESKWCDYVLVSDGKCFGIQCLDEKKCKPSKSVVRDDSEADRRESEDENWMDPRNGFIQGESIN